MIFNIPWTACEPAQHWLDSLPAGTTPQQALDTCTELDWILWLADEWRVDTSLFLRALVLRAVRVHAAAALRFGGLLDQAGVLASLPEDADLETLRVEARAAPDKAPQASLAVWQACYYASKAVEAATTGYVADAAVKTAHAAYISAGVDDEAADTKVAYAAERQQQLTDARKILGPGLLLKAGGTQQ